MLLREDVVLGRAGRVSSSSRRAHVGVARQGVGGCCLGGHAFLFRVDWRIYLARRATGCAEMAGWIFFVICSVRTNELARALSASTGVCVGSEMPVQRSGSA